MDSTSVIIVIGCILSDIAFYINKLTADVMGHFEQKRNDQERYFALSESYQNKKTKEHAHGADSRGSIRNKASPTPGDKHQWQCHPM